MFATTIKECQFECHNLRILGSVNPQFSSMSGDVLLGLLDLVIVIISLILKFSLNLAFTNLKTQSKMIRCVL
jgi:hypothetical protein